MALRTHPPDAPAPPCPRAAEFDALKLQLRQANSVVTAQGPRCSIRTRRVTSDASVDYLKLTLINVPAALVVRGAYWVQVVLFAVDCVYIRGGLPGSLPIIYSTCTPRAATPAGAGRRVCH